MDKETMGTVVSVTKQWWLAVRYRRENLHKEKRDRCRQSKNTLNKQIRVYRGGIRSLFSAKIQFAVI